MREVLVVANRTLGGAGLLQAVRERAAHRGEERDRGRAVRVGPRGANGATGSGSSRERLTTSSSSPKSSSPPPGPGLVE